MKRFWENIVLILFAAVLLFGLSELKDTIKNHKAEDDVVEAYIVDGEGEVIETIQFEEGMTWKEWINSDYYNDLFDDEDAYEPTDLISNGESLYEYQGEGQSSTSEIKVGGKYHFTN